MSVDQFQLITELYPLRRDIISDSYDQALNILCQQFPLRVHEYASGTRCWTWRVPEKWICQEGYVESLSGRRILDQIVHPLYVASYSCALDKVIPREELLAHLHVHPHLDDQPPFIFYYYQRDWGFGCGKKLAETLMDEQYRVVIHTRLEPGTLKVAEWYMPGETEDSFFLSAHLCHPGQANDGLSGVVTALAVMQELAGKPDRHYTYRLLIGPETIGSVAWLSHHEGLLPNIKGGIFLDMTGIDLPPALQMSYHGDTQVDRCLRHVHLRSEKGSWWAPYRGTVGNDERQFNAPGVRIPMLSYARVLPWGHPDRPYKEYHSPADNVNITVAGMLEKSKDTVLKMIEAWDGNYFPLNQFKGEVFLAGYDLAADRHRYLDQHRTMLKMMDFIDGSNSIIDIAEKLDLPFEDVRRWMNKLRDVGLVKVHYTRCGDHPAGRDG